MIYEIHLLAFVCWQLVPSSAAIHLGLGEWAEECMEGSSELTHLLLPSFPFVFSIKDPLLSSTTGSETGLGGWGRAQNVQDEPHYPSSLLKARTLFSPRGMPLALLTAWLGQQRSCWGGLS